MSRSLQFVDSHCHLDFADFDADRADVWSTAQSLGVRQLIIPGVCPQQWQTASLIAHSLDGVFYSLGLHPWWVKSWLVENKSDKNLQALLLASMDRYLQDERYLAIGECGLDGAIDTPLNKQLDVFEWHLQLAASLQRPVIIHCRKAHNELIRALKKYSLPAGGVIHGFSGSYDLAMTYCDMGFCLGIGGTITYERANKTREAIKKIPLTQIVLETDAPDMPIRGRQGQRNSPEYLPQIAACLAELRNEDIRVIAKQTTINAENVFRIN